MKNLLLILLVLAACSKPVPVERELTPLAPVYLYRDSLPPGVEVILSARGGKPGKPPKPTQPPPAPASPGGLILVTFTEHFESNPGWRGFTFLSSGSSITGQLDILAQVANYYARYNVEVTMDEFRYQQYTGKKIMAQVTDDVWNPEFPSTGLAWHGSMQIGGNTCYIFARTLYYNQDWVAKLIAHEVGHTAGLYHQEVYNPDCTHVNNYRYDAIMGQCYYSEYCRWVYGQTWSCQTWEDDDKKLTAFFGLR